MNELLLLSAVGVPLLLALACLGLPRPARTLPWGALPGLACALLAAPGSTVVLPQAVLGTVLALDALGAVFLGFCALLWVAAGSYGQATIGGKPHERGFCAFWHLTLAGSLGVFLAADVVSFYLAFACVSLPAYVLVVHERTPASLRAGRIYIALAVFGEMALLAGLLLGVQAAGDTGVPEVRAALAQAPQGPLALACLAAGLGLKTGLVPLHGWLPLAHAAAPVPASAVLSGAMVKAGIIGLLRLLPLDGGLPQAATVLAWVGMLTAWAGILLGVVQRQPKPVLAYSTMSQMGLLAAVIGAGAAGGLATTTQGAAALFALHHGLAKGGLFLAAGLLAARGRHRGVVLVLAGLLGAAIAGLPLSGGALAKLAIKAPLGAGLLGTLATASAIGTTLLMLRFLWLAADASHAKSDAPGGLQLGAFALLVAAALALPWWLAPGLAAKAVDEAATGATLWSGAWPLLLGAGLAALAWRLRWPAPEVPVGDVAALAEGRWQAWRASPQPQRPAAPAPGLPAAPGLRLGARLEAWGGRLAAFPAGAVALALLALVLGWSLGA